MNIDTITCGSDLREFEAKLEAVNGCVFKLRPYEAEHDINIIMQRLIVERKSIQAVITQWEELEYDDEWGGSDDDE